MYLRDACLLWKKTPMHTQPSLSCIYMYTIFIVHRKDCISVCFCWSLKVKATQVLQALFKIFERSLFLPLINVVKKQLWSYRNANWRLIIIPLKSLININIYKNFYYQRQNRWYKRLDVTLKLKRKHAFEFYSFIGDNATLTGELLILLNYIKGLIIVNISKHLIR